MKFGNADLFSAATSGRGKGKKAKSYSFSRSYEYRLAAKHGGYVQWSSFVKATLDDQAEAIALYRIHAQQQAVEQAEQDKP